MEITREAVNTWLEKHRRSRDWLADQCGVGVAAVGHWLNKKGEPTPIPSKHQITISRLMEEDEALAQAAPPQNLVLEFEQAEFGAIEQAALRSGETVRGWAKNALNQAAQRDPQQIADEILRHVRFQDVQKVAEEGGGYHTRSDRAALQQVIDARAVPVLVTDADGVIRAANQRFTQLCGHTPPSLVGQRFSAVLHGPETTAEERDAARRVRDTGEGTFQIHNRRADGSPYLATIRIRRVGSVIIGIASADSQGFEVPAEVAEAELARLAAAIETTTLTS